MTEEPTAGGATHEEGERRAETTTEPAPSPELRQKVVDVLCGAFADDRIEVDEFERRVEVAHRAGTLDELRDLIRDIPDGTGSLASRESGEDPTAPSEGRGAGDQAVARRPTLPPERIRDHSVIAGIMGGGGRAGRWTPARENVVLALMGGCEIDLREALLGTGVTEIRAVALCGGVEIVVPPDVHVECSGLGILGGFDHNETVAPTRDPDAPTVRVTGVAVCGAVEVTVRYRGESAREAKNRLKEERRAGKRLGPGP